MEESIHEVTNLRYSYAKQLLHSMGDLRMYKENHKLVRKRELPNPQLVGLLMGVVALVAPYGFTYYPSFRFPEVNIFAVMWMLWVSTTGWYFEVTNYLVLPLEFLFQLMMIIFYLIGIRILFAYQTMRYFQGKTTRKRLIILGVIAELPMAALLLMDTLQFIILTILGVDVYIGSTYPIPIPCMLVIGILLLRYFPAPGESDWDLKRETRKWWLKTKPESTNE
jgi:hypothetical protein